MDIILKYFPNLSEKQKEQFAQLDELYRYWNERINTISRKDIDSLYEHHVLHALSIAKLISFRDGTDIIDVGCGGGFPGIPLAIMFPNVNFYMVDSIGKKIKVVNEVAKSLGLKNVKAEHTRAENVKRQFDFIVSRAVTSLPNFMTFVKNKVHHKDKNSLPNGLLYLKGGDFMSELSKYKKDAEIVDITEYFEEEYFETKKIVYLQM
ncbi:MAG: 16S rRNA (guanine(527)-N(7))-methyltransferase RsmG [Marinifilaceae bacterium]